MQTQANAKTLEVDKNCEERNEWNHIFFLQNSSFILSTMSPAYIFAAIGMLQISPPLKGDFKKNIR